MFHFLTLFIRALPSSQARAGQLQTLRKCPFMLEDSL